MSLATAVLPEPLSGLVNSLVCDETRQLAAPPQIELSQNHYAHYMGVLAQLPPLPNVTPKTSLMLWGVILARSGGNEQGIRDAVKACT